jgi:hypothetical protein
MRPGLCSLQPNASQKPRVPFLSGTGAAAQGARRSVGAAWILRLAARSRAFFLAAPC